jgi:hypothetical protein
VVRSSIHLYLDGAQIPDGSLNIDNGTGGNGLGLHKPNNSPPNDFSGFTVTYQIPNRLPPLSLHTNTVVFQSDQNLWYTNSWTWTAAWPYLWASNSLPLGALSVPGFSARMVQSSSAGLGNTLGGLLDSVQGAELVLGYNYWGNEYLYKKNSGLSSQAALTYSNLGPAIANHADATSFITSGSMHAIRNGPTSDPVHK